MADNGIGEHQWKRWMDAPLEPARDFMSAQQLAAALKHAVQSGYCEGQIDEPILISDDRMHDLARFKAWLLYSRMKHFRSKSPEDVAVIAAALVEVPRIWRSAQPPKNKALRSQVEALEHARLRESENGAAHDALEALGDLARSLVVGGHQEKNAIPMGDILIACYEAASRIRLSKVSAMAADEIVAAIHLFRATSGADAKRFMATLAASTAEA